MDLRARILTAVVLLTFLLGLAGVAATVNEDGAASAPPPKTLVVDSRPTELMFISPSGTTTALPTGPLAIGSRVLGQNLDYERKSLVGTDFEQCTVTFNLNALCDDMLEFRDGSDIRVSWTFRWPASGSSGPKSFDGVILGGTRAWRGAYGDFHAIAIANNGVRLIAHVSVH